jgi:hypothetical protein
LDKTDDSSNSIFNMYLVRGIEHDVLTTDTDSFIYIKYLNFLQLCPIKLSSKKGWRTARISPNKGILSAKNHELPDYVLDRLTRGAKNLEESRNRVSDKQASVIMNRVSKVPSEKLVETPIAKAILGNEI